MKRTILILVFLLSSTGLFAQASLGVFAGYGQSQFPDDFFGEGVEYDQAGTVPVGAQLLFGLGNLQVGAELNYSALPFTFEQSTDDGTTVADIIFDQIYYGALAKLRIGSGTGLHPYVRAGAGFYTGKAKVEWTQEVKDLTGYEDMEMDFKSAFGVNLGGGIEIAVAPNTGVFGEVVYHMVKRTIDTDGAEGEQMNNMAIHVGVMFSL